MNAGEDRVVVIGAGPAGIGAGIGLGERGTVLEGSAELGGLCRTIERDGAVFDLGGHSFHTPHPEIRDLVFGAVEMHEQQRQARCHSYGAIIGYPFQEHFQSLTDPAVVDECTAGLASARGPGEASDFEEFIELRFGSGIARHFLWPYNRKLWATDLRGLATDWVEERIVLPDTAGARFATSGGKRTPLQSNTSVAYPAEGGYGEIYRSLARKLPDLRMGCRVAAVDPVHHEVVLEGGESVRWRRLVSTLPIPGLLGLIPDVPAALIREASQLRALSLALVLVVIDHPVDTPIQRIYSADLESPFHKLALNHNSSPSLRSLPRHGVVAEASYSPEKPLREELGAQAIEMLLATRIIRVADEVHSTTVWKVPFAYPIPTHERHAVVRQAKDWLEERGIHTVGRFGEWAYINSDEALYRGLVLGRTLAEQV